jgi:putative aldouronate transport system substrate-binding protein
MSKKRNEVISSRTKLRRVLRFMKKTLKKFAAVGLTLTSVMGLVACGSKSTTDNKKETVDWASVEKPGSFKVMVDGTVVKETNGAAEFYEYYKELTGLDIEWIRPEHSSYTDSVKNTFASGDLPDVVLLSSDYLANFAANGYLWDMTDAWEQSATKNSGRLTEMANSVMAANEVAGPDGTKALYGFSPTRGNGCCTYIKVSSLEAAGYKADEVANKTMTYDEYYKLLKDIQAASDNKNFVISTSGFVAGGNSGKPEAPYTNYLPEFYQDAQFTFYLKDGKYVDGFAEDSMKKAMDRLKTAISDGILDKASQNQSTSDARKKWQSADKSTTSSVFTYWAGTWAQTLTNNLPDKSDSLIAIKPIKELGKYTERLAPAWAITYKAYENGKAEGIFKYFIDTMLDGGDIQVAWEYGAKGTHWDDKAEDVTLKGKEDKVSSYKEGEFHFLPTPEDATKLMSKNHVDPSLAIADFGDKTDPGAKAVTQIVTDCYKMFNANSEIAAVLPATEVLNNNIVDINTKRLEVLSQVVLGEKTYDEAMADYNKQVGAKITAVIESLNETIK